MTAESKSYHHGDLKHTLIEAACRHLSCADAESLSLRALARDAGVSQTAPYRHFKTKNCLFAAIATCGFEEMAAALQEKAAAVADDVINSIIEIGVGYVEWALANPEKYQLFFDSVLVDFSQYEELQEAGDNCYKILTDAIERGVDEGVLIDKPVEEMAVYLWASIHGITSLLLAKLHKLTGPIADDRDALSAMHYLREHTRSVIALSINAITRGRD